MQVQTWVQLNEKLGQHENEIDAIGKASYFNTRIKIKKKIKENDTDRHGGGKGERMSYSRERATDVSG